jgi:hypothetical protein
LIKVPEIWFQLFSEMLGEDFLAFNGREITYDDIVETGLADAKQEFFLTEVGLLHTFDDFGLFGWSGRKHYLQPYDDIIHLVDTGGDLWNALKGQVKRPGDPGYEDALQRVGRLLESYIG